MVFLLVLIGVPVLEVLAFIEVARAIGWLVATVLLLGTSVIGLRLLRSQGRLAVGRVSLAVSERRAPGRAAVEGALGLLGSLLLVIPGFLSDIVGALLLLPPTRALTRRWLSHRYAARVLSFATTAERFTARNRATRSADVESTAYEDDAEQLGR